MSPRCLGSKHSVAFHIRARNPQQRSGPVAQCGEIMSTIGWLPSARREGRSPARILVPMLVYSVCRYQLAVLQRRTRCPSMQQV